MRTDTPFDGIDFGSVPEGVDELLQAGVVAYRSDRAEADTLFRAALALDPAALPTYFCLYKIHTYSGRLDAAQAIAEAGLVEAARQTGWPVDWRQWVPSETGAADAGRFALYTLKALAFIALRDSRAGEAAEILAGLKTLDPQGATGWQVVADLASGCAA